MKSYRRRALALGLLAGATLAPAAHAYTGDPAGERPASKGPDLLRAEVVVPQGGVNLDDQSNEAVTYCFDTPLETAIQNDAFVVQSYDVTRRWRSIVARRDETDSKCVRAEFEPGANVLEGTIAAVEPAAVLNNADGNPAGSEPLERSQGTPDLTRDEGATTAPDLRTVTQDPTANTLTYTYDEVLDPALITDGDASRFFLYLPTGEAVQGSEVSDVVGKTITIRFDDATVDVADASRYFTEPGAVRDRPQSEGPDGELTTSSVLGALNKGSAPAPGGRTLPISATPVAGSGSQYDIAFNKNVTGADVSGIHVVRDAGTSLDAELATVRQDDNKILRVNFGTAAAREPDAFVRITLDDGAVSGIGNSASLATDLRIATTGGFRSYPNTKGYTSGPDLLLTEVNATAGEATFTFDEQIDPQFADTVQFRLLRRSAVPSDEGAAPDFGANGRSVKLAYSNGVADAAGGAVSAGAVRDRGAGNFSPIGGVSLPIPPPEIELKDPSAITPSSATLNATVDPGGQSGYTFRFEYGLTTAYDETPTPAPGGSVPGSASTAVSAPISGLVPNTEYHYRVIVITPRGEFPSGDSTFTTLKPVPEVTTQDPASIGSDSATVSAAINPNGLATTYKFVFGTTQGNLNRSTTPANLPAASAPQTVQGVLTGLEPNKKYFYRAEATNATGTSQGEVKSFTAQAPAPEADTSNATLVTTTTARLNGIVTTQGVPTTVKFEYGPTVAYGSSSSTITLPGDASPTPVSIDVSGLQPNTNYNVRIVATNTSGTANGPNRRFLTPDVPQPPPPPQQQPPAQNTGQGSSPAPAPAPAPAPTPEPAPAPAPAAPLSVKSSLGALKGKAKGKQITGKVQTSDARCRANRTITVKKGTATVGTAKSKADGTWTVKLKKKKTGKYKVTVSKRTITGDGGVSIECAAVAAKQV